MGELASVAYIAFARRIQAIVSQLNAELASDGDARKGWLARKPLLKRIDEYNYMKCTIPAMKQKKARTEAQAKA